MHGLARYASLREPVGVAGERLPDGAGPVVPCHEAWRAHDVRAAAAVGDVMQCPPETRPPAAPPPHAHTHTCHPGGGSSLAPEVSF